MKKHMFEYYKDQLDDVDPIELGRELFLKGEELSFMNDPTRKYRTRPYDNKSEKFLEDFYNKIKKGWHLENSKREKENFEKELAIFQENLPVLGSELYVEFPTNKGKFFKCKVEHIAETREQVLLKLSPNNYTFFSQSYVLTEYTFDSELKRKTFPKFFKELPNGEE